MTEKLAHGLLRLKLQYFRSREIFWREKFRTLGRELKCLKSDIIKLHKNELVTNFVKPHITRRSVGVQVDMSQKTHSKVILLLYIA